MQNQSLLKRKLFNVLRLLILPITVIHQGELAYCEVYLRRYR